MTRKLLFSALAVAGAVSVITVVRQSIATETAGPTEGKPADKKDGGDSSQKKVEIRIDPSLGILEGRIVLKGEPPEFSTKIEVPENHQDRAHCVKQVVDERVILGKKKELKNVVVSVENYKPKKRPRPRTVQLDNKNCLFVPHVVTATVGSTLEVKNSDGFIHNTRGLLLKPIDRLNSAVPPKGKLPEIKLRKAGWGVFKCDFHPWMEARIHVFAHELFALTKADGTFRIVNIPPGTHKIRLAHEALEQRTVEVKIEAGKTTVLNTTLERYKD